MKHQVVFVTFLVSAYICCLQSLEFNIAAAFVPTCKVHVTYNPEPPPVKKYMNLSYRPS